MNKAFIFTMDAIMALVPIFIITAGISQISGAESLMLQGYILGSEKIAHGTLEVMSVREETEETNTSVLNATLVQLIPAGYNYSYEVEYNGSVILNVTKGNVSQARDVVVARRLEYIKLYSLLGIVSDVSHGGSPTSTEKCPRNGNQPPIYETSFDVETGELSIFDYWLEGRAPDKGVNAKYYITNESKSCSDLQGGGVWIQFMSASEYSAKLQIDGSLEEGKTNYLYLKIAANPNREGDFYVIKAPEDTSQSLITYENAIRRNFAWVTLKVGK